VGVVEKMEVVETGWSMDWADQVDLMGCDGENEHGSTYIGHLPSLFSFFIT
jgi:hypothetical protein